MKNDITLLLRHLKHRLFKAVTNSCFIGYIRQALAKRDSVSVSVRNIEDRSKEIEFLIQTVEERSRTLESLINLLDERSQSLEYLARQSIFSNQYQIDQLQKLYVESMPALLDLKQQVVFNASRILELNTDFPIALGSNDHINPESTMEGVSRPTFFVRNCIDVIGRDFKCLDIGSGGAGQVFEFAMNQILAVGIDGSDFCRNNKIGYWPMLPNNLFTCDITEPFAFLFLDTKALVDFELITMWEVLEHIADLDLSVLLNNIHRHLGDNGYFIGSISLVEYVDSIGNPYHVTLKPRDWWKSKFLENGLVILDAHPFNEKLFCRGNGPRFQDYHNYSKNPEDGFWFVAQKS